MMTPLRAGARDEAATRPEREPADPLLAILVTIDLLLFAGGATAHAGVGIPLGVGTWEEPLLVLGFARLPEQHIAEAVRLLVEAAATTRPCTTARRAGGR